MDPNYLAMALGVFTHYIALLTSEPQHHWQKRPISIVGCAMEGQVQGFVPGYPGT